MPTRFWVDRSPLAEIQLGLVIARSVTTQSCIRELTITLWTHKRHRISSPRRRYVKCRLCEFWRIWLCYKATALYRSPSERQKGYLRLRIWKIVDWQQQTVLFPLIWTSYQTNIVQHQQYILVFMHMTCIRWEEHVCAEVSVWGLFETSSFQSSEIFFLDKCFINSYCDFKRLNNYFLVLTLLQTMQ